MGDMNSYAAARSSKPAAPRDDVSAMLAGLESRLGAPTDRAGSRRAPASLDRGVRT
jgi:hypothetical protein